MTKISVPDIHCSMCVARIVKALEKESIVCSVDSKSKMVYVEDEQALKTREILLDIGFDVK